ncbi:Large exoprotein containing haemagglutination activity domain [Beggiatoa sp. PS]|nr:Large exoprotein containing haemagglutination activity domain [Beggiatoa sp. PS]
MSLKHRLCCIISITTLNIAAISHAEVVLDGTLGHSSALPGPDYLIGADLGQQQGANLFHSFQSFNLQSFESATFYGPNSIQNIISRVTGGNPSQIDGLLRSTIPNADLYFLNPAGVMFGPNARLDIPASLYISTADYLKLKDGGRFDVTQPENSLLTIAPPSAFGFLDGPIGKIEVNGSDLLVNFYKIPNKNDTLAFVGVI